MYQLTLDSWYEYQISAISVPLFSSNRSFLIISSSVRGPAKLKEKFLRETASLAGLVEPRIEVALQNNADWNPPRRQDGAVPRALVAIPKARQLVLIAMCCPSIFRVIMVLGEVLSE